MAVLPVPSEQMMMRLAMWRPHSSECAMTSLLAPIRTLARVLSQLCTVAAASNLRR
jgi:hypothetical protein